MRTPDEVMGVSELPDGLTPIASKRPKPRDKRVWASIERSADAVMDDLFREALKRDPDKRRTWVFLVDGDLSQLARIRDFAALHEVPITVVVLSCNTTMPSTLASSLTTSAIPGWSFMISAAMAA